MLRHTQTRIHACTRIHSNGLLCTRMHSNALPHTQTCTHISMYSHAHKRSHPHELPCTRMDSHGLARTRRHTNMLHLQQLCRPLVLFLLSSMLRRLEKRSDQSSMKTLQVAIFFENIHFFGLNQTKESAHVIVIMLVLRSETFCRMLVVGLNSPGIPPSHTLTTIQTDPRLPLTTPSPSHAHVFLL